MGLGAYFFLTRTEEGRKVGRQIKDTGSQAVDELAEMVEDLEEKSQALRSQAAAVQVKIKQRVESVSDNLDKEGIEEIQQRGRKLVNRFFTRNGQSVKK